jgi:predicted DNA-binding transcriptional regulator AlpA
MNDEQLLNASQLASFLGLSTSAVLDRWERGDLPGFRLFGRKGGPVRFRLSEIEEVLEQWRSGPDPRYPRSDNSKAPATDEPSGGVAPGGEVLMRSSFSRINLDAQAVDGDA